MMLCLLQPLTQEENRKDNKERSEKSPEKKPLKNAVGRGKQLARMSKKELKAQVGIHFVDLTYSFGRFNTF